MPTDGDECDDRSLSTQNSRSQEDDGPLNLPLSQKLISVFIVSFAISGIVEGFFGLAAGDALALVHVVAIALICFVWCKADISERGIAPPMGSAIFCGVLPVIGVPVHFFRTRPVGAAFLATGKALAVFAVSILVYGLTLDSSRRTSLSDKGDASCK